MLLFSFFAVLERDDDSRRTVSRLESVRGHHTPEGLHIAEPAQQRRSFTRDFARNGEYREARLSPFLVARFYWQAGSLKLEMVVLQLKVPLVFKYSLVYQNVQLSTGSIAMLL